MNNIQKYTWLISIPRIVVVLFIILNIIAMFCYQGGTYHDNFTSGYSFAHNFLSDLGRTISFSGEVNFLSAQLFNMSLILSGGVFVCFYINVLNVFSANNQKILATTGSFFGVLGGLSLIGVGLTPSNLYLNFHITCATWLFRFLFIASFCYTIAILQHQSFKNKYAVGYLVFAISILLYILISELGPKATVSQFALILQVVSQKIILFIFLAAIYIQTYGLQKINNAKF